MVLHGKEPGFQFRRHKRCQFDPWVRKISWERAWQPTPIFLPGESHKQRRSLVGYSPQVAKSQTLLKQLSTAHRLRGKSESMPKPTSVFSTKIRK